MRIRLLLLCIAELLLITFCINLFGPLVSPVLLLLVSTGIAVSYLHIAHAKNDATSLKSLPESSSSKRITFLFFVAFSAFLFVRMFYLIRQFPVSANDVSSSDIIPSVIFFAKRTLAGAFPYTPIHFSTHDLFPTYLTFTWLPFCVAEFFKFDYRWIAAGLFWLTALFYFLQASSPLFYHEKHWQKLLVSLWPLVIWSCVALNETTIPAYTIESLIAAYYLLLALATQYKNILLLSVAISLCLLSRYSILFWVPLCFFILLTSGEKKRAFLMAGIILAFIFLGYILPFLTHDPQVFIKGYNYYTDAAMGEWIKGDENKFWHLGNGLGFSKWMFTLGGSLPLEKRLFIYQRLHIIACITAVIILFIIYRSKKYDIRSFLLFSLKIYLAVFYAFVQVPYKYLFIVPVMVSSVLLLYAFSQPKVSKNNKIFSSY